MPIIRAHRQTTEAGILFDQNGLVTEIREKLTEKAIIASLNKTTLQNHEEENARAHSPPHWRQ
ncbi:MAG: hypothetical protein KC588_13860 [Nitrospira sp.]|nr:hypothetical protein [Nitrospira sp.]